MGGTAALIVAADVDPPAVVTLSAPVEFQGLNAAPAAPNIKAPVLLLASTEDTSAAESLRKLSGSIPNDEAKLFDGDAHGTNLLSAKPETSDVILDFLSKHAPA
jgi:pimeloyl-ACP methyl ester carboxylesterase